MKLADDQDFTHHVPLTRVVAAIYKSRSYEQPTVKERFCWNIIQYICESLPTSLFDVQPHLFLIENIGGIYKVYCADHEKDTNSLPPMSFVIESWPSSVQTYFKWIASIHEFLRGWKMRFDNHDITVKEIHYYEEHMKELHCVADFVGAAVHCFEKPDLDEIKLDIQQTKEDLTSLLLFSVKDNLQEW